MTIPGFRGIVLRPDHAGFDSARHIFNRELDRTPALIARPAGIDDVVAAVRYAAESGLPFVARGAGHNFAGYAASDGGLVLDLRSLQGVRVDPQQASVEVAAGMSWGPVDAATHVFGLATTGGSFSTVGVVGFTLGTGLGWLGRAYGTAGDNLLSATVVTADGRVHETDENEEPELFWTVRGGTGNFGVVTSLTFQVHPVRSVIAGMLVFPFDEASRVLRAVRDVTASAHRALSWAGVLATAPPAPTWPDTIRGRKVLLVPICWAGPAAIGQAAVAAIRAATGPAALDLVGPMSFPEFQASSDASAPEGMHWDVRSEWLSTLDDAAVDAFVDGFADAASPLSEVLVRPTGGAIRRGFDTPFGHRDASWLLEVLAGWTPDDRDGQKHRDWMIRVWRCALRVSNGGPCISHLGLGEEAARGWSAFTPPTLERLRAAKRRYDPANLFRAAPVLMPPQRQ